MRQIDGGITASAGFTAAGIHAGIKKRKKDLALLVSDRPCTFAGSFTTNIVKAAPVSWDQAVVATQATVKAVIINSGNANACTGEQGEKDCKEMAALTASALDLTKDEEVLVCSTGVIGVPMPMQVIQEGIKAIVSELASGKEASQRAAEAILTTDTFTKEVATEVSIGGKTVRIGGMAKGSGMIHPNMATMLSFITTDAGIEKKTLQMLLDESIQDSYNMISVDGDTSTNDTVLVLANGASGADLLDPSHPDWDTFKTAFNWVNTELAKLIIRDGEGATKLLEFRVHGASDTQTARTLARAISSSSLVKTAYFGSDANWGRILCAMGYSGAAFDPNGVDLFFKSKKGEMQVVANGEPLEFDEREARNILMEEEVTTVVLLKDGQGSATAWGCDLSYEYVRINGEYRS